MIIKKSTLKFVSLFLTIILIFQQIPFSVFTAEAASSATKAAHRILYYTDPFKTDYFSHFVIDTSNLTDLPEYAIEAADDARSSKTQRDNWKTLTETDMLSPGEIHRRVQDDLWDRYESSGTLNGGELAIKYDKTISTPTIQIDNKVHNVPTPSKITGRADIYRENVDTTSIASQK